MSKLFNSLKRNFVKIIWSAAILVWVGVGIYYFSTRTPSSSEQPSSSSETPTSAVLESLEQTHFVVGQFEGWEEIEDLQDRYILLSNPETKRNYPKIKVVWESDPYKSYQFWEGMIAFSVEKTEEEYDDLGYLKDFTSEEISQLIKKGDLVKVVFEKESIIEKLEQDSEDLQAQNLKGKADDFLALSLSIKGLEGKAAVEKELGREIQRL